MEDVFGLPSAVLEKLSFLIVDDDAGFREIIETLLKNILPNSIIHPFSSPVEAISFYRENYKNIDIVLTDLNMPEMTGLQFAGEIKKIHYAERIILITAHTYEEILNMEGAASIDYLIPKDYILRSNIYSSKKNILYFYFSKIIELKKSEQQRKKIEQELMAKNKSYLKELRMAGLVQRGIIPNDTSYPQRDEFEIGSLYMPMDVVGGDLFDIIRAGRNGYCFLMLDVSGHGISAALITTMAKVLFTKYSGWNTSPAKVCTKVNHDLFQIIGKLDQYFSAFYAFFNVETGLFKYTSAGHPAAILHHLDTDKVDLLESESCIIGAFRDAVFYEKELHLTKNDRVIFFTDGIIEAAKSDEEFYGTDRFIAFIKKNKHLKPQELTKAVVKDVEDYCGHPNRNDDLSLLILDYKGSKNGKPVENY